MLKNSQNHVDLWLVKLLSSVAKRYKHQLFNPQNCRTENFFSRAYFIVSIIQLVFLGLSFLYEDQILPEFQLYVSENAIKR